MQVNSTAQVRITEKEAAMLPQEIVKNETTITLCANCHYKIHRLIQPLIDIIIGQQIELKIKPNTTIDWQHNYRISTTFGDVRLMRFLKIIGVIDFLRGVENKPFRHELLVKLVCNENRDLEWVLPMIEKLHENLSISEVKRGYYQRVI